MAETNYSLQFNFKQGPDVLINVPIFEDDPDLMGPEVERKLNLVFQKAELTARVQAELSARAVAAGLLGARTVQTVTTPQGGAQRPSGAQQGPGQPPLCSCGVERFWKEGQSKAGNNYKGWFCVNNQCSPDFRK